MYGRTGRGGQQLAHIAVSPIVINTIVLLQAVRIDLQRPRVGAKRSRISRKARRHDHATDVIRVTVERRTVKPGSGSILELAADVGHQEFSGRQVKSPEGFPAGSTAYRNSVGRI